MSNKLFKSNYAKEYTTSVSANKSFNKNPDYQSNNISVIKPVNQVTYPNTFQTPLRPISNIMKGMFSYPKPRSNHPTQDRSKSKNDLNKRSDNKDGENNLSCITSSSKRDLSKLKTNNKNISASFDQKKLFTFKNQPLQQLKNSSNFSQITVNESRNASKDSLNIIYRDQLPDPHLSSKEKNQSNLFSEMTYSRTFIEKKLEESILKPKSVSNIVYNSLQELESRRMILEMTKLMLKNNPCYKNDPRAFLNELNVDISLLDLPNRTAQKFNTMRYDKYLNNPSNSNISEYSISNDNLKSSNKFSVLSETPKNINFEISNDQLKTSISPQKAINNNSKQSGLLSSFSQFNLDEDSSYKMKWLSFLITPKVVFMENFDKQIPYILKLVPTNLCYYGLENYILEFEGISGNKDKGCIDLSKINHSTQRSEKSFGIAIEHDNSPQLKYYEFFMTSKQEVIQYVSALNYVSQLVKCKLYVYRPNIK